MLDLEYVRYIMGWGSELYMLFALFYALLAFALLIRPLRRWVENPNKKTLAWSAFVAWVLCPFPPLMFMLLLFPPGR